MAETIRIANCSGFYGDRLSAAAEMVHGGPIDVLTGDWLAELTMLILARTRQRRPGGGYARSFVRQMEQVMTACLEKGVKVVSNAGGLDPSGCAEAVATVAERLGLSPKIAWVSGDDLLDRLDPESSDPVMLRHFASGEVITDISRFITANAYLGAWGIVEALRLGADIVITGRVTDAAVVCGPAAWHHGWQRRQLNEMAGAVVAGHVIECGTQATGGNYSFLEEIDGLAHTGFPWAEIAEDGSSVIGKHDNTGGSVTVGTVTAQLLYEIDSPAYLGPDVTARFDTIRLEQVGADRVSVTSVKGEPAPPTLKVATNSYGGFRSRISVALTGLDIDAKARLVDAAFWRACPYDRDDYDKVVTQVIRTDKPNPNTNEEAVAEWRLTVFDSNEKKLGRTLSNAMNELALATIPGMFSQGGAVRPRGFGIYRPALVDARQVPQYVNFLNGTRSVVDSATDSSSAEASSELSPPGADVPTLRVAQHNSPQTEHSQSQQTHSSPQAEHGSPQKTHASPQKVHGSQQQTHSSRQAEHGSPRKTHSSPQTEHGLPHDSSQTERGSSRKAPLGRVVGTRSGDKGGNANLGVFARSEEAFTWLDDYLTVERLRELLPETAPLAVDRYRLPNILSLNFVIHGLLGDGVAASARQDPQAKSLGEWLRAKIVDVPVRLLADNSYSNRAVSAAARRNVHL